MCLEFSRVLFLSKAPKLRLALIVSKSWLTGLKMYVARLGVTRYVVPDWKPPWLQFPFASVVTAAGIGPLPDTRVKRSDEHTSELQSHHDLVCRLRLV